MNYFNRLIGGYTFLKDDFTGIHFDIFGLLSFLYSIIFALILFIYFYMLGKKICSLLFSNIEKWSIKHFINITIGYIFFNTGIAILGMLSLLTPTYILCYLGALGIVIIFPINQLKVNVQQIAKMAEGIKRIFKPTSMQAVFVLLFIVISFLRLIPPEINSDAMSYHADFPKMYLYYQTTMLSPKISINPTTLTQLGEMPYVLSVFFHTLGSIRIIHFIFYLLCIFLVYRIIPLSKKNRYSRNFVVLIVSSTPLVLHIAPSGYSDFQTLFCFLTAILVLTKEKNCSANTLLLAGIILGGALSGKLFALAFVPGFIIYIFINGYITKINSNGIIKHIAIFTIGTFLFPIVWYIRSFLLSGSIFGYFLYNTSSPLPIHSHVTNLFISSFSISEKININFFKDLSPLFFFGIISTAIFFRKVKDFFKKTSIGLFIFIFFITYIFFPSMLYQGRYFLQAYFLLIIVASVGISLAYAENIFWKRAVNIIIILLIFLYSINTLVVLPYGIGWANKDVYLSRVLTRYNGSYYDFNNVFSKHMKENEEVATYNLDQFYYSNFIPISVYYFFEDTNSLSSIKVKNVNRLLIRGGDILWFCKELEITDCDKDSTNLLASDLTTQQYLYQVR